MVTQLLHQIVGPKANPLIDQCLSSWKVIKDYGFEIRTWNDDSLEEFIDTYYPWALQAFSNARNHAEAADIARYLLVHHTGGIYMDWDVELLMPELFFTLLERTPQGFLVIDPANGTLASEAFSAEKNEAYLLDLVRDIVHLYNNNERENLGTPQYSGPFRMRDSLVNSSTAQLLLPVKEVFAYDYTEIREFPDREINQPLIHYWIHSWI